MFFSQEELVFRDHAMGNHPLSNTLFGNLEEDEEMTQQEYESDFDQGDWLKGIDKWSGAAQSVVQGNWNILYKKFCLA